MDTFGRIVEQHLRVLAATLGEVCVPQAAPVMAALRDDDVVSVISATTGAIRELESLRVLATGIAAQRSTRDAGHGGLAQKLGHRSAVTLVQDLTGVSRTQAGKVTRLGQELLEVSPPGEKHPEPVEGQDPDAQIPPRPWHACLGEAFTAGRISVDQQTAIRRGLGEPPARAIDDGTTSDAPVEFDAAAAREVLAVDAAARDAWATAAEQLIEEAARRTVEDLAAAARAIRDVLDPEGAARRFSAQVEGRSFRLWTNQDGVRCASIRFEPGGGAWATAIIDTALRPRRGGPRFVDPTEQAAAEQLVADPRTNEQLAYDLLLDLLRTGALADAATVFGTRQAGVRVTVTETALETALHCAPHAACDAARDAAPSEHSTARTDRRSGIAVIEDTNQTVPATFAAQRACDTGTVQLTTSPDGNPLNLGRQSRLFTAKQRLALSARDGGCRWTGCDRPAAFCEAHHIDRYSEGGRTDIDRGILLCPFHHMNLHHHGWRITRDGTGPFLLHSPDTDTTPIVLHPRLERRYAFGDLQPPPTRFRPAA